MTETTDADDDDPAIGWGDPSGAFGCPVGRQAGIGQRRDIDEVDIIGHLDERALGRHQKLGETTVRIEPRESRVCAVHILPDPAAETQTTGRLGMTDDPIPDAHAAHGTADRFHNPSVLVAERVREEFPLRIEDRAPDPLDDVEIGAAQASANDANDHLVRLLDGRIRNLLESQFLLHRRVVAIESRCQHPETPFFPRQVGWVASVPSPPSIPERHLMLPGWPPVAARSDPWRVSPSGPRYRYHRAALRSRPGSSAWLAA
ncbi:hypothetical protein HRbin27_00447 [bacterium HR27]|nr:hypothetical protein HRbin27_00447 [bacterium HR27]